MKPVVMRLKKAGRASGVLGEHTAQITPQVADTAGAK